MNFTREFAKILESRLSNFCPFIQILVGPRQVGKSTAVKKFLENYTHNSIYVALDNPGKIGEETIRFHWNEIRKIAGHKILVFDEIQNVPNWAPVIKELYDEDRDKRELSVLLLGSSALDLLLRGSESLLGRYEIIRAHHWSQEEHIHAHNWTSDQFFQFGGYPGISELLKDQSTLERCQLFVRESIIEPIISKDILSLSTVLNTALFRQVLEISLSLPAEEISFSKMLGQLNDKGNSATIKGYLELLEKAFLIKLLYRYSEGKIRMRTTSPKIVPLAPALIHAYNPANKIFTDPSWFGKIFEISIIAKFHSQNFDLYYWRSGKYDVDFIAKKNDLLLAFEVKSNSSADWKGLIAFKQEYPKAQTIFIDRKKGEEILVSNDILATLKLK